MPRTRENASSKQTPLQRASEAITGLFRRRRTAEARPDPAAAPTSEGRPHAVRSDIPMDQIAQAYVPTQGSMKGPFRASGADRQRDQEFGQGGANDRWNDEDRLTNKSGDPRIGTHGRTYEPAEQRAAGRGNDSEYENE